MKTRNGYVSNSSSSSFILGKCDDLSGITANDMEEAVKSVYPTYDQRVQDAIKAAKEYGWDEDGNMAPFSVYDVSDKDGHDAAVKDYGRLLSEWISHVVVKKDGKFVVDEDLAWDAQAKWERYTERLSNRERKDGYSVSISRWSTLPDVLEENDRDGALYKYENGKCVFKPIPKRTLDAIETKWNSLGLVTNRDLLDAPESRFLFHFDENDIYGVTGMTDKSDQYTSEEYSMERFVEILVNALKKAGKLPADYDYKSMLPHVLTACMHEG